LQQTQHKKGGIMNNQELRIELLLEDVVKKRASDLHIQVGLPPMLRIDGRLMPVAGPMPPGWAGGVWVGVEVS